METHLDQGQAQIADQRGGVKPIPFIIANEVCERIVTIGIQVNMILYLTKHYHLSSATSAIVLFAWNAAANFLPVIGAVVSDALLGRFLMITLTLFASTIGTFLLWLTAMVPNLRPPDRCQPPQLSCNLSPTSLQLFVLFSSFTFMSFGASGIRPCCLAFGEDQFSQWPNGARKDRVLRAMFDWYYVSVGFASIVGTTLLVFFQDKMGWKIGFAIPLAIMALATFFNLWMSPLYIKVKPQRSIWIGLARVVVIALKHRHLVLPEKSNGEHYYPGEGPAFLVPTQKMRFLNKACLRHISSNSSILGGHTTPCTVEQVENLKSAISVFPMWSAQIMCFLIHGQSFGVLQASAMDRRPGTSNFKIPAGSISIFQIVTFTVLSGCYDRYIVPVIQKITGRQQVLTLKQRMGLGVFLFAASAFVASLVEATRRNTAIRQGPGAVDTMSAMWLAPQYILSGIAFAFGSVGQIEYYYSVLPKAMGSFVLALLFLASGVASVAGMVVVKVVNAVTRGDGRESWLSDDLDKGRYDYYYLLLGVLGAVNLVYFIFCCYFFDENRQSEENSKELREIA